MIKIVWCPESGDRFFLGATNDCGIDVGVCQSWPLHSLLRWNKQRIWCGGWLCMVYKYHQSIKGL